MTEVSEDAFRFGKRALVERGYNCCGKPQGCTNQNPGCAYLNHPYKRAMIPVTIEEAARLVVDAEYRREQWGSDTEATFDRAVAVLRETVFNERDLA